jgi:ribA/ribD-fused uncharacterized protein
MIIIKTLLGVTGKIMIQKFEGRYGFLSNFYPCLIEHKGISYPSVEHFYVAMKCNGPQFMNGVQYTPADFREMIARIPHPGTVKKLGKKMSIRSDWNEKKLDFMNWGVREKFKDIKLVEMLLDTGDEELVEGNIWNDTFWGVCDGKGKNHLGKILMKVRDEIRGIGRTGLEKILL